MIDPDAVPVLREVVCGGRWACLATLRDGAPLASWVAYALDSAGGSLLMHLSRLAVHTRNLLADGRASLTVSFADDGREDPQELARVTLNGTVVRVAPEDPDYAAAKACYLARFPAAEQRFEFADFSLFRLPPAEARFVGGFARAYSVGGEALSKILSGP